MDEDGSEYIYLQGIASVAAGSWVTYDVTSTTGSTTALLAANGKGPVAIAMAAIVANKFGWFQIFGLNLAAKAISGGDAAAGAVVYGPATAGSVDDVAVAGDLLEGALFTVQEGEVSAGAGYAGVFITYPFVSDASN